VTGGYVGIVIGMDGFSAFNGRNIATTGSLVFGASPVHPTVPQGWETSAGTDPVFRVFRAQFSVPTDYVAIDLIADDDDIGELRAFGAAGQPLGMISTGQIFAQSFTAIITRPTADIAYITAAGLYGESMLLDNLQFNNYSPPVPEPGEWAMLVAGLLLLGLMRPHAKDIERGRMHR
jgi:hypothetical protein